MHFDLIGTCSVIIAAILWLKLSEMIYHGAFAVYGKEKVVSKFKENVLYKFNSLRYKTHLKSYKLRSKVYSLSGINNSLKAPRTHPIEDRAAVWPATTFVLKAFGTFIAEWVFVLWLLMFILTFGVIFSTNYYTIILTTITLLCGAWIGIIKIATERLYYGSNTDYERKKLKQEFFQEKRAHNYNTLKHKKSHSKAQSFVKFFARLTMTTTISYAGVYYGADSITRWPMFEGVQDGYFRFFDLLYFSAVTVSTVGYGNVSPSESSLLARFLVGTEVIAGFALLVVIVTVVNLTFENKE